MTTLAPDPLAVLVQWAKAQPELAALIGTRVGDRLIGGFPALRLADLGPLDNNPGEWTSAVQVECWAETYAAARDLARTVSALILAGTLRGNWAGAGCAGGRTNPGPYAAPDPESSRYRFILTAELWLYTALLATP